MKQLIKRFVREDEGQDLIEYVLICALVSVAVLVGAGNLGTNLEAWYTKAANWVSTTTASSFN